jgi:hypothetical protein
LVFDQYDNNVTWQNAALWIGLHPDLPGARDENNDGRIDGEELRWGVYDLQRISTVADPFPDDIVVSNTQLDSRDWKRGVSLFEYVNRKLDLRRPLLIRALDP